MNSLVIVCQTIIATNVPVCSNPMPEAQAQQIVAEMTQPGSTSRLPTRHGLSRDEMSDPYIMREHEQHSQRPFVIVVPSW